MGVEYYITQFAKLRRDHKFGGAPHKPILLLAIFSLIRKGIITSIHIEITPELVLEFKEFWNCLVETPHTPNFSLPFFHMRSEPFWTLITKLGAIIPVTSSHSIKSFRALHETVLYAVIDIDLYSYLQDPTTNFFVSDWMVNHYFKNSRLMDVQPGQDLFSQLEAEILQEDKVHYQQKIKELEATLSPDQFAEEVFVRSGVFKREILKIYNYTCAISGMRIETSTNVQMVDACHIIPFATSLDDTIGNGICLSPNLHRAFDRGLITITESYKVKISSKIKEANTPFMLFKFEGMTIKLPENSAFMPLKENIAWHQQELFLD